MKSCESCRHYLGGGCCGLSMEMECRDGGGFEAWECSGKTRDEDLTVARSSGDYPAKTAE